MKEASQQVERTPSQVKWGVNYERIVGMKFKMLTAVRFSRKGEKGTMWIFKCDCGQEKEILASKVVSRGRPMSCGCAKASFKTSPIIKHGGMTGNVPTKEYKAWRGMMNRCYNKNSISYKKYGGSGIKVCPEWMEFVRFKIDMGPCPSPQHSLGRINNSEGYYPENCRWETFLDQQNNKSTNRFIPHNGRSQTMAQWARELEMPYEVFRCHIRHGKSISQIMADEAARKEKP